MYHPTVSSDHSGGQFGGFPWHENRSYKNFILHYFYVCLVLFPSCPSCLFSIIPPSVTEGVRSWGSLRKDGKLEMHLRKCLVCIQWFILPYTLKVSGNLALSLHLGRASKKRMRKEYSIHHLNLVKILTLQAFPCARSLCRGSSDPAVNIPGAPAGARWDSGSDSQGGKTLCLHRDLCSPQ